MLKKLACSLAALVVALFITSLAHADTLRVPEDYATITAAVGAAVDGDSVLIAPGTYDENGINLYSKAITITGTDPLDWGVVESTIVDAHHRDVVFLASNGNPTFMGLTIRGGHSDGMFISGSLTVSCCLLLENELYGISHYGYGEPAHIDHSRFVQNGSAGISGGGVTITRCSFEDNSTALYVGDDVSIHNCTFSYTRRFFNFDTILMNRSVNVEIANCVLTGNPTFGNYGINIVYSDNVLISNCTVAGNSGGGLRSLDSSVRVVNSIFWGNAEEEIIVDQGEVNVTYSNIQDGWPGIGNIDAHPGFTSARGFEYLLKLGSPCIDAGDPTIKDGISDWHPRWPNWYPNGERSDMGAYGGTENRGWLK